MAEEADIPEAGEPNTGVDPTATAMALGGASREEADAFLRDQRKLIAKQNHHLDEQLKRLKMGVFSDRLSIALKLLAAFAGFGFICFLGAVVWDAAHDDGLVVEAFSVPPDLAASGLTGQVVATQLLDDLSAMQAGSANSARAPSSYANDWGNDIKVEIPETGISIGEFNRYLHQLLGHQTHITGEVVRRGTAIIISARAGTEAVKRVTGSDDDFDALLQQTAEAIYARTQFFRYGAYLLTSGRTAEAIEVDKEATRDGSPSERAWAYSGLSNIFVSRHMVQEAVETAHASVMQVPNFATGWFYVAAIADTLGHDEEALKAYRTALDLYGRNVETDLRPEVVPVQQHALHEELDRILGDYSGEFGPMLTRTPLLGSNADPADQLRFMQSQPGTNPARADVDLFLFATALVASHDLAGARRILREGPSFITAVKDSNSAQGPRAQQAADLTQHVFHGVELTLALANGDWQHAVQSARLLDVEDNNLPVTFGSDQLLYPPTVIWPQLAFAEAMSGDFAAAHAQIDKTPADCDLCLRIRGKIDAAQKNYNGAAFWFARAAELAPSIPFAYADWGAMLLQKGDPDGAMKKFTVANQKGPHFADPLEGWGEAMMAKNRSDLALAKFEEANKYAPNWGRLHLKWGEALYYAGKKADAAKQFAQAATLDLTASEKADLAGMSHG